MLGWDNVCVRTCSLHLHFAEHVWSLLQQPLTLFPSFFWVALNQQQTYPVIQNVKHPVMNVNAVKVCILVYCVYTSTWYSIHVPYVNPNGIFYQVIWGYKMIFEWQRDAHGKFLPLSLLLLHSIPFSFALAL